MNDPLTLPPPPLLVPPVDQPVELVTDLPPPPPLLVPPVIADPPVEPPANPPAEPEPPPPPIVPVHFARFDANGRYTMTGVVPSNSITLEEPDVHIGIVDPATQYHTADGPVDMPPQPTPEYKFNYETKTWGGDVEELRTKRHTQIEAERDARLVDPVINYNGTLVDADGQAEKNLQQKVTATASRIANNTPTPPQMLVWKDHTNVIHAFPDLVTYKEWLDGFVIAMENRGMAIWAWSWNRKDALNALTTFEQVVAFDPTAGSPKPDVSYV